MTNKKHITIYQREYRILQKTYPNKDKKFYVTLPKGWALANKIKPKDKILCEVYSDNTIKLTLSDGD